jgi:DNA mismatch repair protein MutS
MPPKLLDRANEILAQLEEKHADTGSNTMQQRVKNIKPAPNYQLNIFDGVTEDMRRIQQLLDDTDINTLTPVEALMKLNEMKGIVKQYRK